MNKEFTEDNIEQIQKYLHGKLPEDERTAFELEIAQDESLKQLVDHYRIIKEGFELKELAERRKQLEMIRSIADETVTGSLKDKMRRQSRLATLRKVASYAAVLFLGLAFGWFVFKGTSGTGQKGNTYTGTSYEQKVVYDGKANLVQLNLSGATVTKEVIEVSIIITKMPAPLARYDLEGNYIEIIFDPKDLKSENLEGAKIDLILEKIDKPSIRVALLKIDQLLFQIPLADDDFEELFN